MLAAAAASALIASGLGFPSTAGSPAQSSARSSSYSAAAQRASISVLPPISQVGKGVASPSRARTVVAAKITPVEEGRPVVLSRLAGNSWIKVAKTRLTEKGLAEFGVATIRKGEPITYRATALKFGGQPAITTGEVDSGEWGTPDFVDEFSGRKLGADWSHRFPGYNPEGLRRCSRGSSKAVRVVGGAVQLSVLKDKSKGNKMCVAKRADGSRIGTFDYRLNGHISTAGMQGLKYGVAAARMKFQKAKGQHSSFWMQPLTPDKKAKSASKGGAEIDIIEWFGHPSKGGGLTSFIYHPTRQGQKKVGDFIEEPDQYLSSKSDAWWKQFHVFSVEWTPKAYVFRIDGRETFRTSAGVSKIQQFPILSLLSSDYELENLGENRLPQKMSVDWVQLWDLDGSE